MFEVKILTAGNMQIGWVNEMSSFDATGGTGVGDGKSSFMFLYMISLISFWCR